MSSDTSRLLRERVTAILDRYKSRSESPSFGGFDDSDVRRLMCELAQALDQTREHGNLIDMSIAEAAQEHALKRRDFWFERYEKAMQELESLRGRSGDQYKPIFIDSRIVKLIAIARDFCHNHDVADGDCLRCYADAAFEAI